MTDAAVRRGQDEPSVPALRFSRGAAVVICSGVAVALLVLAVPRTIAAWSSLEAQPVFDSLLRNRPVSDADLAAAIAAQERAVGWFASSRRLITLAPLETA